MNFPTRGIALAMRSRFPSTPDLTRPYSQLRHDIPGPAQTMTGMTYAKAITLTLILSLLFPIVSRAEMMSAQDLITACSADQRGRGVCDGYLMAVTDAILLRETRGRAQGRVCVPQDVTVNQVRDKLRRKRLAYTTVLSVMQKLDKAGWLTHREEGRAYVYRPAMSRDEAARLPTTITCTLRSGTLGLAAATRA